MTLLVGLMVRVTVDGGVKAAEEVAAEEVAAGAEANQVEIHSIGLDPITTLPHLSRQMTISFVTEILTE